MNLLIGFYIIKHGIVQMEYIFNELDKGYCVSSLNCFLVALKHYGFGLESTLEFVCCLLCVGTFAQIIGLEESRYVIGIWLVHLYGCPNSSHLLFAFCLFTCKLNVLTFK
jgi:hypothetical protein